MNDDKSNTSISESFVEWMAKERKRTGKSESKIIEESFKDGWLTFMVEESTGKISLDSSQVFKAQESPKDADTWKRLRDEFAPISACVDYIRDNILGSGLKIIVNDKDAFSKELKEYVEKFVEEVYQDDWKVGLEQLLSILVDDGIVYGVGTAEICYNSPQDKPILFDDYVENVVLIKVKGADNKEREIPIYKTKEPDWKTVGGIARLKIINSGYKRLKLYRDPQSWLPRYWTLDESIPTEVFDEKGMRLGTLGKSRSYQQPSAIKLLPWQVFWLPINQRDFSERGVSMVAAVSSLALILERIMKAVGEGIYRAGNKKYFIVCTEEGTPVWTPEGYRKIEDIKVGDNVWSKHSTAEVLQTFKNPYKGDLYTIKPKMLESVSFTPNHPIKVAKKLRLRTKEGHDKYLTKFEIQDEYKRADELTTNDWLIVPKIIESKDIWINFPNLNHNMGKGNGRNPEVIPSQYLSEDLGKLFGWYLAEGSCQEYNIQYSLNSNETQYAQEILDLSMQTLGLKGNIQPHPENNSIQVVFTSKVLTTYLQENFGNGAENKHLPNDFLYWRPEILNAMVSRIVMGDGHLGKDHWFQLKLNSYELQKQLQLVLMKLGHRASIMKIHRNPIGFIQGRQVNQHDAWRLTWNETNKSIAEDDDNQYFRIEKISIKPYEGYVYNLHTSMNEYYIPFETKNCGTEKRPWSEPYIRNIIQELKEAAEKNWSTIPVPSGFDVKEIGGQVFEASDVVEYFLKVISHAMHVPVRVVGLTDKGIEVNYNYSRLRNEVLASVKNQLILRQIWCEYGKKKTKQGGKGEASLKCPEIRFKTEGLLSEVDRLKMNVQLLNVANPLSPTVKLEIEKSICDIMGWDENKLPTQENLQKQLDEMDKALKDKLKPENPLGKEQGQPQPQTVERQEKRLEAGVGTRPAISQKGQSRSMGGTRIPSENKGVQETEEEYIQNDPQTIIIKTPMTDVLDALSKDLLEKQKGLAESQKELVEKQKQREEEESRKIQRKLDAEITSIKSEIENKEVETRKVRAEIERINAESENIKEGTEKVKTETEEIRKTQTKKREAIDKIMKENEVD